MSFRLHKKPRGHIARDDPLTWEWFKKVNDVKYKNSSKFIMSRAKLKLIIMYNIIIPKYWNNIAEYTVLTIF